MTREINYSRIPEHMQDGMRRYIENGIPPGSFQRAVLSNDLMQAFARADDVNVAAMADYARFLYNDAPVGCYGSIEAVKSWVAHGGMSGRDAA